MVMARFLRGKPVMMDSVPGSTWNAGDVIVIGNMPVVAHTDNPPFTETGGVFGTTIRDALAVDGGIYQMTADQNYYPVGTYVYWDPTAQKVTGASGAQCVPFGWIVGLGTDLLSDTATSTTVSVRHDPSDDTGMVYNLGAQSGDNITNTANETAFATTAVIPANTLVPGDVIHVRAVALVTAQTGNDTNAIKLKILTAANTFTTVINTGAVNGAANAVAIIDADLIFTAVGNSGAFYATGDMAFGAINSANRSVQYLASTNINTTPAVTIEVTDTCNAASASNNVQLVELLVEKRRK